MDDQSLLEGLQKHDKETIRYIFRKFFPMIENHVRKNGRGSREEAEDLFMTVLEIFYVKLEKGDFGLTSSFSTLFYEISKRQWLRVLAYKRRITRVTNSVQDELIEEGFLETMEQIEKYQLYREKFTELSEGCQKVLTMSLEGHSMKEIMLAQGFASEQYARKRKFKCKEKLIQLIQADSRYQELKDHD